jgi:divalent metal cation (Fe/Co/Zn/Cd) transporter
VLRFRRSRGIERQQLKWFLFVASISASCLAVSIITVTGPISDSAWILGLVTMAFVPIAIGVAVLRYRLYEIDRIVSRVVGYALVTAAIAALFVAVVLVSEALLAPFTEANSLAVVASTLIVATVFQPLRRAIQRTVDRRFDRSTVDADRAVALLADRLRAAVELDGLEADVLQTVAGTVHPVTARIWLRRPESRTQEL